MQPTEYYRDVAKTCISNMIYQLISAMQNYNTYVHKDALSAGLYNAEVFHIKQLLTSYGFKPNVKQAAVIRVSDTYLVYKSLDFEANSIQLRDLGVTDIIGNCGDNTIHKFKY